MKYLTVVIELDDDVQVAPFHANMEMLGGIVTGVAFNDALQELSDMQDKHYEEKHSK